MGSSVQKNKVPAFDWGFSRFSFISLYYCYVSVDMNLNRFGVNGRMNSVLVTIVLVVCVRALPIHHGGGRAYFYRGINAWGAWLMV